MSDMTKNKTNFGRAKRVRARSFRPFLLSTVLLGGLTACSSVPDAVNPVEWYKGTVDYFADDGKEAPSEGAAKAENKGLVGDKEGAAKAAAAKADADKQAAAREAAQAGGGLVSDKRERRYASAPIPRQDESAESSAIPKTAIAGATQPPPPAMPAVAVTPAPMARTKAPAPAAVATAAPSSPPPPAMSVGETFKLKLAQKYKPSGSYQPSPSVTVNFPERPTGGAANAMIAQVSDPLATVVISSDGVMSEGAMRAPSAPSKPVQSMAQTTQQSLSVARGPSGVDGGAVKVATILFTNGRAVMSAKDKAILAQVIRLHKQRGGTVRVVGHASSRTRNMDLVRHKMVNFKLSAERADVVARELMKLGLSPEAIAVVARSDSDPVFYEIMPSGEAGNRRTEIYLDS